MGRTARGIEVSTDDDEAIAAVDRFTDRLAGLDRGAEEVIDDAARWTGVAALALGAAMLGCYGQTAGAFAVADRHLARLADAEPTLLPRERAQLDAVRRWRAGDHLRAAEAFEAIVATWPRDVLALKALEFVYYLLGQQHMGRRFAAVAEQVAAHNPHDPDVLAVWAFACELSGDVDRAEALAEQALAERAHNAWAHHALAHAAIVRGDPQPAVDRLRSFAPVWATSSPVIAGHNGWHLAVACLDRLDVAAADSAFGDLVWGRVPGSPGEIIDAVSYLWRREMAGWPVADDQWATVADVAEQRVGECVFPFLSAHLAFVLARARRSAALDELLAGVDRRVAVGDAEATRVWQPLGRTVVAACAAAGKGDEPGAAALLEPVMGDVTAVGGSDAQDDLFRQAYLCALLGAGRRDEAAAQLARMTAFKEPSPLDDVFAARVARRTADGP